MIRTILCAAIFCGWTLSCPLYAQIKIEEDTAVKGWKKGGFFTFNLNQVALINWAAGGESALSSTAITNLFLKYRSNGTYFETVLDAGYGLITTSTQSIRKNEDKIELNSKFGKKAKGNFYYAGMMNFRTQFAPGFNFPNDSVVISDFMAPGFLSLALGMDYKPNEWFSVFLSPATGRATFVANQLLADEGQFGVAAAVFDTNGVMIEQGKRLRLEFGAYLRARLQKDITKNIQILTNLQLFNNYTDPIAAQRGNIDVNWESLILIKANKWLTTSLFMNLIYDHDIQVPVKRTVNGQEVTATGPRTQFKEVLGLGLSFKF
jgi:hypothetical protein